MEKVTTTLWAMTDIESMGTKPGCPVLTIGAVLFDPTQQDDYDTLFARAFIRRVDLRDAVRHSEGVNGDTLAWWLGQEDAAIKELIGDDAVPLKTALIDFSNYLHLRHPRMDAQFFEGHCRFPRPTAYWAKSPEFDYAILEEAARRVDVPWPLKFWEYRDVRTIEDCAWPSRDDRPVFKAGTHHDARADACNQAMMVQAAWNELGWAQTATFKAMPK